MDAADPIIVNFFKPFECTEANFAKYVRPDSPGVFVLVETRIDGSKHWAYVGKADDTLIDAMTRDLVANPTDELRAAVANGATFGTAVVRDPQAREMAYAYLTRSLQPRIHGPAPAATGEADVRVRVAAGKDQYPALPESASGKDMPLSNAG